MTEHEQLLEQLRNIISIIGEVPSIGYADPISKYADDINIWAKKLHLAALPIPPSSPPSTSDED